jgi:low temperature requirement protein LtrA
LLIVYAMWWLYFYRPVHDLLRHDDLRRSFIWGYGHFAVFTAAAAVGAGLAVAVDVASHHAKIGAFGAAMAVAIPVAIYVGALWVLHHGPTSGSSLILGPVTIAVVLLAPLAGLAAIPLIGAALAILLWTKIARLDREPTAS